MKVLETITCPIEGQFFNQEFDLYTIFDINTINRAVSYKVDYVHKVLLYIINNPSLTETEKMDNYLKKQLNQDCYNTYHQIINNFDRESNKFKRYYY